MEMSLHYGPDANGGVYVVVPKARIWSYAYPTSPVAEAYKTSQKRAIQAAFRGGSCPCTPEQWAQRREILAPATLPNKLALRVSKSGGATVTTSSGHQYRIGWDPDATKVAAGEPGIYDIEPRDWFSGMRHVEAEA